MINSSKNDLLLLKLLLLLLLLLLFLLLLVRIRYCIIRYVYTPSTDIGPILDLRTPRESPRDCSHRCDDAFASRTSSHCTPETHASGVQWKGVVSNTCYRAYFPHLGFPSFPTTHS